jgi:hypothetical protein
MRSHRVLLILLAAITAVVVAVFIVTITRDEQQPPPPVPPNTSTETTRPPSSTAMRESGSDLFGNRLEIPAGDAGTPAVPDPAARADPTRPDYLATAPAQLRWQRGWGGAALPVSTSDGPTAIRDGIASGFARTPQGAALAAADALGRALAAPDRIWQRVLAERYYGGGQALVDRFARSRARTPDAARYVTVPDGVRIASGYSSDYAIVEFATRDGLGYRIARWPMIWIDGDWRVSVPSDIETLWGPGTYADLLAGFGTWRTVS